MKKSQWLALFNAHVQDLGAIVARFHRKCDQSAWLSLVTRQDPVAIGAILQTAWEYAPDKPWIHEIRGWGVLCDLCSECYSGEWVPEDPEPQSFPA